MKRSELTAIIAAVLMADCWATMDRETTKEVTDTAVECADFLIDKVNASPVEGDEIS